MNSLIDTLKEEASYLDSSKNKLLLVGFLAVFTFIFLSVYNPFNMVQWGGSILIYIGTGVGVFLFTQFPLRYVLKLKKFRLYHVILWLALEVLLIAFFVYLIYGPDFPTVKEEIDEYLLTLKFVSLTTIGPYVMCLWFFASRQKISIIKQEAEKTVSEPLNKESQLFTLTDDNNKVLLAIRYDQILYLQSSGNYVDIFYLEGERVTRELVRVSLKELENRMENAGILRIHRSYMVNKDRIATIKKTRKGYDIKMQYLPTENLSVSSSYKPIFEEQVQIKLSH